MKAAVMATLVAPFAMLFGCATAPESARTSQEIVGCAAPEPRIGTLIVRKEGCVAQTPEEREAARRQLEMMQAEQERKRINTRAGS